MPFLPDCKDPLLPMPKIFFPSDLINRFLRVTILYLGGEGWAGGGQGEGVASLEDDGETDAGDGTPACCLHRKYNIQGDLLDFLSMYFIQHCFICRPSDSLVSADAGIEPRTVATSALAVRRSSHSARSHPHSATSHNIIIIII